MRLPRVPRRSSASKMGETDADGRVTLEAVYCLGLCHSLARRDARSTAWSACSTRRSSTLCWRRRRHERARLHLRAIRRALRRRRRGCGALSSRPRAARPRRRDRAHRLARHVLAGAAGRGRAARGPHRLRAGQAVGRRRACSTPACSTAASIRLRLGLVEDIPFLKRQTRLTFARCGIVDPRCARRLPAAWRLQGPGEGARRRAGGDRRGGRQVGLARPRRRGLPDRHQVAHRRRDTAAAEIHRLQRRRRRSAAPSPTA